MSFDDDRSQADARWREDAAADQAHYWDEARIEAEQREAAEGEAASEAHWHGAFQAYPEHLKRMVWPSRSLDRRLHDRDAAVLDGEVIERDVVPPFNEGSAA